MRLHHLIHAPTRPAWTARIVIYIALIVTITILIQVVQVLLW